MTTEMAFRQGRSVGTGSRIRMSCLLLLSLVLCGCGATLVQAYGLPSVLMLNDIPIPPSAEIRHLARFPIRVSGFLGLVNYEYYDVPQPPATVVSFYQQSLQARGWSLLQKKQGLSADETCLLFTKFGMLVSIGVDTATTNGSYTFARVRADPLRDPKDPCVLSGGL
jgi:hypothetical protein